MPFIAVDVATGERIDITDSENPREQLAGKQFRCQLCELGMIMKPGFVVTPHFAHRGKCTSGLVSHPESEHHRQGKKAVARFLKEALGEHTTAKIEYEVPIQEAGRVADVLITFPMGWSVAHEVQLAGTGPAELAQRTEDYAKAGIDTVWWLGRTAGSNPANRTWCIEQTGVCHVVSFRESERSETLASFDVPGHGESGGGPPGRA